MAKLVLLGDQYLNPLNVLWVEKLITRETVRSETSATPQVREIQVIRIQLVGKVVDLDVQSTGLSDPQEVLEAVVRTINEGLSQHPVQEAS